MTEANQKKGKKNRKAGADFEKKVRALLESNSFIVARWTNNVDLEKQMIVPAKSNRFMMRTCGFPDFIIIDANHNTLWLVECKRNGYVNPEERQKIEFIRRQKINVTVAYEGDKGEVLWKTTNSC